MSVTVGATPHATASTRARSVTLPWYVAATLIAATSAKLGVIWDISWHRSIGRDTFWTPAHLAIYLGGVLAGVACGSLVLKTTFAGTPEDQGASVGFWGFRGPLGAWVSIWGAFAMITSAPFDNWWHNAYGLDVKVLSPPHVLLALGIWGIQLGALFLVLSVQNRSATEEPSRVYGLLAAFMIAILLQNVTTIGIEQVGFANLAHNAVYYKVAAGGVPLLLVAAGRGVRLRWPATTAAVSYMAVSLVMIWILQLAPASPKLAPVFNPVTHLIPPPFPLLLVIPAVAIDFAMRYMGRDRDWRLSVLLGVAFLATFLVTQWFFAEFLLGPHARNYFFGVDQWDYSSRLGPWRYRFWRADTNPVTPTALAIAAIIAVGSARIGLWWGNWMARLRR
ncbi:MAG TPA: hypothetical protein VEU74_06560 [Gemmatimonadales bacterium]|nr:hypothetical protein [Gemmatimonadales bacterium]